MKKKNARRRKPQRRVILDFRVCVVAVFAMAALQFLLFIAGWITGEHAIEPMKMFAHDARVQLAAMIAPEPATSERAARYEVRGTSAVAVAAAVVSEQPITLLFEALPRLERPVPTPKPLPKTFTPEFYSDLIRDAAEQHDVPPALVAAVVKVESDFDARAVSSKGARGLMQVMPATARRFGVPDPDHLFYPAPNLSAGTAYLAWLLKRYDGNLDLVLAAYNAGEGAVQRYHGIPPYRETQNYVKKVRRVLGRSAA